MAGEFRVAIPPRGEAQLVVTSHHLPYCAHLGPTGTVWKLLGKEAVTMETRCVWKSNLWGRSNGEVLCGHLVLGCVPLEA